MLVSVFKGVTAFSGAYSLRLENKSRKVTSTFGTRIHGTEVFKGHFVRFVSWKVFYIALIMNRRTFRLIVRKCVSHTWLIMHRLYVTLTGLSAL